MNPSRGVRSALRRQHAHPARHERLGQMTDDRTEIRTRVVLDGRSLVEARVKSVGLSYDAYMNGVHVARSEKKGVSLNRHSTTIHLSAYIDRSSLLGWWRTHVNNDERTRLVIKPHITVDLPYLDLSAFDFAGLGRPADTSAVQLRLCRDAALRHRVRDGYLRQHTHRRKDGSNGFRQDGLRSRRYRRTVGTPTEERPGSNSKSERRTRILSRSAWGT